MASARYGSVTWWRIGSDEIGARISLIGSRERYRALIARLEETLLCLRWHADGKYWTFPKGLNPDFLAFCERYGLTVQERDEVQPRLPF